MPFGVFERAPLNVEPSHQVSFIASTQQPRSWDDVLLSVDGIVRELISSATGQRPTRKPNLCCMYGWRWMHGR